MSNKIELQLHKCTRVLSKFSTCDKCITSCPTDAISLSENFPKIDTPSCIECGACVSICPTEAIDLDKFSPIETIFGVLESESATLDCKKNIPCLASLSPQNLVSMVILKDNNISANLSHCESCEIFGKVGDQIASQIEEANFLLEAFGNSGRVVVESGMAPEKEKSGISHERRAVLDSSIFRSRLESVTTETSKKIREKNLPDSRKLFLMALKRVDGENSHILDSGDISFFSQKRVTDSCTNCQICYRVCPSEALTSDYKSSYINFSPNLCLKCHLCHDVCEPDAIQLEDTFQLSKLLKGESQKLIEFDIGKCDECGTYFTKRDGKRVCYRCEIEEEEAMELWR
jgi:energy-converting hydrogenase A subunit P